ncbi:MAG: ubiquitin-like domain-containing protein [Desulfotomaculaceae bacterium]|nr:ubiquitin-like domain-containing protein [Desulfotomaculaceae bacterium]
MNWYGWLSLGSQKQDNKDRDSGQRGALFLWSVVGTVIMSLMFCGYTWAQKSVVVLVDGNEKAVRTFSSTVGSLLEAQKISLLEKDEVIPAPETPLQEGMVVTLNRAVDFNLVVDGTTAPARTRGRTVGDILIEYGINLGPEDEVSPGREEPVVSGMQVQVARVSTVTEDSEVPINYETKKQYTVKLEEGTTRVAREGQDGTERQTWQVVYKDNKEVSRQLVSREIITPPVDREILVGSGMVVSRGGENIRYSDVRQMVASGYTYTGSNTASGVPPHYGVVAVDTAVVPFGTRLYVEGYGYATAMDRGGAIRGNRLDLFFESESEALSWGMRTVNVYFIK